jgi:hypothetical protein
MKSERYYSVEEDSGMSQIKRLVEALKDQGTRLCIVSAAGGDLNPLKTACARHLGFAEDAFLRGHKKWEQALAFLQPEKESHDKSDSLSMPIHTLILIDDTRSYIDDWGKQALKTDWSLHSNIKPSPQTGTITIVGMHYDFFGQRPDLISQKMIGEFIALYGRNYLSDPLIQPFIATEKGYSGTLTSRDDTKGKGVSCFFPFFGK